MSAHTPMLKQYFATKAEYPGVLLAMRVGDFYEFYGDAAETAARDLQITLTGREDGPNGRVSMAGVPFHSVERYLARLVAMGHKVALCDQLEDPKKAKGLVRRGVTRVLTPGTVLEDSMLAPDQSVCLVSLASVGPKLGIATLDPSTGEFWVTEIETCAHDRLMQELARLRPAEVLLAKEHASLAEIAKSSFGASVTTVEPPKTAQARARLMRQFSVANFQGFGCEDSEAALVAASMVVSYAERNGLSLNYVTGISTYSLDSFMRIEPTTRRSLELTANLSDGGKRLTLYGVLDLTVTPMGSRLLARWINQPLLDKEVIQARQDSVERLLSNVIARGDLRDNLKRLSDIERLASRIASNLGGPRDLAALRNSLLALPALADPLALVAYGGLQGIRERIGHHHELLALLAKALVQDPPHTIRDGGVIREGFDAELDKLRSLSRDSKGYIAGLEKAERERTGISQLKVGYNSVFGYYLEAPKSQQDKVPPSYVRKQTTANSERYVTTELKEQESLVLGAEEKAAALENDLFQNLRQAVAKESAELLSTGRALAELDVLAALAEVAAVRRYVKPEITDGDGLEIEGGRHPVVEEMGAFVPNDLYLAQPGAEGPRVIILTGPNMSGKSTYLRQTALIALMAQIGSFVPARRCALGLCDRIFARVGAKDELAMGQSTFMVEMSESANILNHASSRSLVILDEVGRGTSTYDGLAIAWAMAEHLAAVGAKTMFATHYHQLNALADEIANVANFAVAVEEIGEDIVWTHRVLPGGTDRSYGVHVARMAGVPHGVLERSAEILSELEARNSAPKARAPITKRLQLTLFEAEEPEVIRELAGLNVDQLTPVQALALLDQWKRRYGQEKGEL